MMETIPCAPQTHNHFSGNPAAGMIINIFIEEIAF
jgi:hypothetical protein